MSIKNSDDSPQNQPNSELDITEEDVSNWFQSLSRDSTASTSTPIRTQQERKMSDDEKESTTRACLEAVAIKAPTFNPKKPETWFIQMEAQFTIAKITKEQTKLVHVCAGLPPTITENFDYLMKKGFEEGDYEILKNEIIKHFSESETCRLNQIMETEQLGDRKPSQFYRFLKSLVGDMKLDESILRNRWMIRLPPAIQNSVISMQETEVAWDKILNAADKIYEMNQASSNQSSLKVDAVAKEPEKSSNSSGQRDHSGDRTRKERSRYGDRPRSRDRYRNRSPSPGRRGSRNFDPDGPSCWYHFNFGKEARKCNGNCKYEKKGGNPRQ
jgi:hypothetical protein